MIETERLILREYTLDDFDNLEAIKKSIEEFAVAEIKKDIPLVEKKSFATGFAVFDDKRDTCFGDVFNRADAKMYECKKAMKGERKD